MAKKRKKAGTSGGSKKKSAKAKSSEAPATEAKPKRQAPVTEGESLDAFDYQDGGPISTDMSKKACYPCDGHRGSGGC